jgi:putative lipoic acid-binding regulatory protein
MIKVLAYLSLAVELIDAIDGMIKGIQGSKVELRPSAKGNKFRVTIERI